MLTPASPADVQDRLFRPLTTQEQTPVATLLTDAWVDLQSAVTDLVTRLEDTTDPEAAAALQAQTRRVLAQAVVRVLKNPNSRKQESRGLDDAQRAWTLDESVASGLLYFTDAELDSLRDPDSVTPDYRGKAFSVTPT